MYSLDSKPQKEKKRKTTSPIPKNQTYHEKNLGQKIYFYCRLESYNKEINAELFPICMNIYEKPYKKANSRKNIGTFKGK